MHRPVLAALGVGTLALALSAPLPAGAAPATPATPATPASPATQGSAAGAGSPCKGEMVIDILPGVGLQDSSGSVYTRSGTITCDGLVQGRKVTGPGTYSAAVRYGDPTPASCVRAARGWGLQTFTFPTAGGPLTIRSLFSYTIGPFSEDGLYTGRFAGDYFSGTVAMTPVKGDCVTSAVTRARATFVGGFHEYEKPQAV